MAGASPSDVGALDATAASNPPVSITIGVPPVFPDLEAFMQQKIGIIGYGRFGQVMAQVLDGFTIYVDGLRHPRSRRPDDPTDVKMVSLEWILEECDVIVYACPINSLEPILVGHLPHFAKNCKYRTLIDVLSVKKHPAAIFERRLPPYLHGFLTHPMFGPDSVREAGLEGKPIVLDKFNVCDNHYQYWMHYFSAVKHLKVVELTADEHDRLAANSQGMTHFIGRLLDKLSVSSSTSMNLLDTFHSRRLKEITEQTCNDTWELFMDLQTKNPYTVDMRVRFSDALDCVLTDVLDAAMNSSALRTSSTRILGVQGTRFGVGEYAAMIRIPNMFPPNTSADNQSRAATTQGCFWSPTNDSSCQFSLTYFRTAKDIFWGLNAGRIDAGVVCVGRKMPDGNFAMDQRVLDALAGFRYNLVDDFTVSIQCHLFTDPNDVETNAPDGSGIVKVIGCASLLRVCTEAIRARFPNLPENAIEALAPPHKFGFGGAAWWDDHSHAYLDDEGFADPDALLGEELLVASPDDPQQLPPPKGYAVLAFERVGIVYGLKPLGDPIITLERNLSAQVLVVERL